MRGSRWEIAMGRKSKKSRALGFATRGWWVIDSVEGRGTVLHERGVPIGMAGLARQRRSLKLASQGVRSLALAGVLLNGRFGGAAQAMADPPRELDYNVKHSVFGDIGTYSNTIETAGAVTTIKTTAHFKVTALGVGLHREDAQRVEQWQNGRLMFFHGVTVKNGETTEVKGQASGSNFVINSPLGQVTAPGSVKPANPWSKESIQSSEMMRVDSGKVEKVTVSAGGETNVSVGGASTPAREYDISGATKYKVFIDNHDVPVMFVVDDDSGQVTFTLKK
jgi:Family of unknown function (DUF6134)